MFDDVVDEYDRARPSYPASVFDALEPLNGLRVLDGGAGTGIASRALEARGAHVAAFDVSRAMLRKARSRNPMIPVVRANGAALPFRSRSADMVCFAQSWHWIEPQPGLIESARVLRTNGRWCAWWSHARADGEVWFDQTWAKIERACPGAHRDQRDTDWGTQASRSGLFSVQERITVPWTRHLRIDQWMTELRSTSYIAALAEVDAAQLVIELRELVARRFDTGDVTVPYETWLWIGTVV